MNENVLHEWAAIKRDFAEKHSVKFIYQTIFSDTVVDTMLKSFDDDAVQQILGRTQIREHVVSDEEPVAE